VFIQHKVSIEKKHCNYKETYIRANMNMRTAY